MANYSVSTDNPSGRAMVKYPKTKSDPICKWRNATVEAVILMVSWLPKEQMSKIRFREYMSRLGFDFFHTPYQLAAQLGLYYEDNDVFVPRFDHDISEAEARIYMRRWMERYYVPNPFTKKGFVNVPSMNLQNALIQYMENHPNKPNLATAGGALFGGEMGNLLCVKYVFNEYSDKVKIDSDNNIIIKDDTYGDVEVSNDRNDKKAFFEHFND